MKALEKKEKDNIKFRYAVGLYKAFLKSRHTSYRQLAKEAGMEPAHMQKVSVGKLDVSLTTNISIANALGISYTELAGYYDSVTKADEEIFILNLEEQKKLRGKSQAKTSTLNIKSKTIKKGPKR